MHPRLVLAVALCLVLASCATTGEASPPPINGTTPTQDVAAFIAAINEAAIGTSYEDAALDDPEVFIGVGQLFCELLDDGLTVDSVLAEYLTALEDQETGTVSDDDALITGVLMGAAIEILCPQHQKKLG